MYTFSIVGVSPVLYFFNQQQELSNQNLQTGVEYVPSYHCTLDALLQSVEEVSPKHAWALDEVVDTVVDFWINNADTIRHWKHRLEDTQGQSLLVSRVANIQALKHEFEFLFES
jgi:plasmid maintenance system antidote protein VapI